MLYLGGWISLNIHDSQQVWGDNQRAQGCRDQCRPLQHSQLHASLAGSRALYRYPKFTLRALHHVMACRYPEVAPLEGLPLLQQKPQNSKPWQVSEQCHMFWTAILVRCLKSWHQARSRFVAGSRSHPLLPQRWGWFLSGPEAWQGRSLMVSRSCFFISDNQTVSTNGTLPLFHLQILVNLQTHVWFTLIYCIYIYICIIYWTT